MRKNSRRSGLTMIEVLVASIILTVLVAMSSWLVWGSSKHVSRMEVDMAMENGAREVITMMTKELHQVNMANVKWVDDHALIDFKTALATPGNLQTAAPPTTVPAQPPAPKVAGLPPIWTPANSGYVFNAIRYKLPGPIMEITTKNANANVNKADASGKMIVDNFDLAKFKANKDLADYNYEVQYWWEIDTTNISNEGTLGVPPGPNGFVRDGVDNNKNGVIDEGVIKKSEVWYDSLGNVVKRNMSVVLRDVKSLTFTIPGFTYKGVDAAGVAQWYPTNQEKLDRPAQPAATPPIAAGQLAPGTEKIITVEIVMERVDPSVPRSRVTNPDTGALMHVIQKTFRTMIEVRNK